MHKLKPATLLYVEACLTEGWHLGGPGLHSVQDRWWPRLPRWSKSEMCVKGDQGGHQSTPGILQIQHAAQQKNCTQVMY